MSAVLVSVLHLTLSKVIRLNSTRLALLTALFVELGATKLSTFDKLRDKSLVCIELFVFLCSFTCTLSG